MHLCIGIDHLVPLKRMYCFSQIGEEFACHSYESRLKE
jgi:hypothetical protein